MNEAWTPNPEELAVGILSPLEGCAAAVRDGKITPAQRDDWAARYDEAPQVVTQILASLAAGTAVPVAAAGHTGGEVTGGDADLDAMYAILYPEVSRG